MGVVKETITLSVTGLQKRHKAGTQNIPRS